MKYMILQPHSRRGEKLPEWLGPEVGRDVILITPEKRAQQYGDWAGMTVPLTRYEPGGELECVALKLAREHRIERIVVLGEYDIVRAAQLQRLLGLPGQSVESAVAFRDKSVMKRLVSAAGIPVADFVAATSPLEAIEFVERVGFPVVAKPFAGWASAGTIVLRDRAEMEAILSREPEVRGLVEAFVPGPMYHVDGFVHRGRPVFMSTFRYVNDMLAFHHGDYSLSVQLDEDNPFAERLEDFTRAVLAAMPALEAAPFHLEVFRTPDDRIVFNEIASRTGGSIICDVIERSHGIHLAKVWIEFQLGLRTSMEVPKRSRSVVGLAVVPPLPGRIEMLPTTLDVPGILEMHLECREGDVLQNPQSSSDAMAELLGEGPNEAELVRRLETGIDTFRQKSRLVPAPQL